MLERSSAAYEKYVAIANRKISSKSSTALQPLTGFSLNFEVPVKVRLFQRTEFDPKLMDHTK